jgi:hypothetical protein
LWERREVVGGEGGGAHAAAADSLFSKTSGRSRRDHKTVWYPDQTTEVQEGRRQEHGSRADAVAVATVDSGLHPR